MSTARPFRFGVVFTDAYDATQWAEHARRIEAAGFATLLVADHHTNPMACTPLIVAAACATTTLRVGSYVYDNDFRHPALLAKEVATMDVPSGGRMELGIGAGYYRAEYDAVGLPFDPPGVRVGRMEESIAIMRRLFAGEKVDFDGRYYRLHGYTGRPLPIQQPPPILIGGGGPRMTRLAARMAEIVAFVPRSSASGWLDPDDVTPASLDAKVALLNAAVAAAGREDGGPLRSVLLFGLYPSADAIAEGDRVLRYVPREMVASSPYALVGDAGSIVETLHARRERWGLNYYVVWGEDFERFIPVVRQLAG